jgi:hypothetical protein
VKLGLYAQVNARAAGRCEACGDSLAKFGQECDHFFGRRNAESLETCWMLCPRCHFAKTRNHPGRGSWLLKFIEHCGKHGYADAASEAQRKLEWYNSKTTATRSLA